MNRPIVENIEYLHEALLYYATPESGYHDSHYIPLDTGDPAEVNSRVHNSAQRSKLAFFHVTRRAIITVDHGETDDVLNMSQVHYDAEDGLERVHGNRLMTPAHFIAGETDYVFDLLTEAEIIESQVVPDRVSAWLTKWREGNYMSTFFPEVQKLL